MRKSVGALLFYTLISLAMTWPLPANLSAAVFRGYGDVFGDIWTMWGRVQGVDHLQNNPWVAAPFGASVLLNARQPVLEFLLVFPAKYFGEVASYNVFCLFSLVLTAFFTYLFLHQYLRRFFPSFLGGFIFGFSPAAFMRVGAGHLGFVLNLFFPLLLWSLLVNRERRTVFTAMAGGCFFALLTLTSLYWGYFAVFIVFVFCLLDYRTRISFSNRFQFWANYGIMGSVAFVLVLPFELKWIKYVLGFSDKIKSVSSVVERPLIEMAVLSARPWEYFLPSVDHPLWGNAVWGWLRWHLHGSNIPEQSIYLGVVPVVLFIGGFYFYRKNLLNPEQAFLFRLFLWCSFAMLILSAPPYIPLGKIKIPLFSYFLHGVAPMFRAYCRFGILLLFFVGCGAAVGVPRLQETLTRKTQWIWGGLCMGVLLFEFWNPPKLVWVDEVPPVYEWLAQQPGDVIVAEYPMAAYTDPSHYTYLFWQRIHRKRLVNGAQPTDPEAWSFYQSVKELSGPTVIQDLRRVGTTFVIIHDDGYEAGLIPFPLKRYFAPHVASLKYNNGISPEVPFLGDPCQSFGPVRVYCLEERGSHKI